MRPLEASGEGEEGRSGPGQTGRCSGTSATSTQSRVRSESRDSDMLSRLKLQRPMPAGPSRLLSPCVGGSTLKPSTWPKGVPVQASQRPR